MVGVPSLKRLGKMEEIWDVEVDKVSDMMMAGSASQVIKYMLAHKIDLYRMRDNGDDVEFRLELTVGKHA